MSLRNFKKNKIIRGQRFLAGLTLLELVVVVSLFGVLTLIITKTVIKVNDIQDRTSDLQNVEGDLRYAMGVFSEQAREATTTPPTSTCNACPGKYYCVTNGEFFMVDKNENCVKYSLVSGALTVTRGGTSYAITSSDISIDALNFSVSSLGDRVLVQARASGAPEYNKSINYQTAITSTSLR